MNLFNLFSESEFDKEVIIKDECEKELFKDKFSNVSMKYAEFKVCKVVEENGIIVVYI